MLCLLMPIQIPRRVLLAQISYLWHLHRWKILKFRSFFGNHISWMSPWAEILIIHEVRNWGRIPSENLDLLRLLRSMISTNFPLLSEEVEVYKKPSLWPSLCHHVHGGFFSLLLDLTENCPIYFTPTNYVGWPS